ncbi:toxin YdaT domain-containing protein [Citrobacter sedlakii]|uniref:toxin YdaT domain-containing protein n=1 Tax=Citrobacter sedlakii TaxID=67826 RepID=UPI001901CFF7|nr:toxin YdaT domain-containing protein [Citrobacter sedlakii]MBJ9886517.1 toxin YdaT domain-containing protein [Citrobacter sedlakii]
MHAISYQQNTGSRPVAMINRNQPSAADKHEQIRDAVRAWAASLDNQDVVAGIIVEEWEQQGGAGLEFPEDLSRKRQKLFRWLDGDTGYARERIRQLTPAILAVLPLEFRGRLAPQDDFIARYAAMEKEVSEAKRALMLRAPQHQMVKEVREGIEKMLAMLPAEAMGQVLSGLAALAPGVM